MAAPVPDRPIPAFPPATHDGGMTRRAFLGDVAARLRRLLPPEYAPFRVHAGMNLVKIVYANDRVHYEVWVDGQRDQIEIGLHFEDGPVSTAAYLAYFDRLIVELKHELGPRLELERWTPSWGHCYELLPLGRLDTPAAERAAGRLAALIVTLEPLVRAAGIPPERSARSAESRGPWRTWRRR